jgi:type IV secretion system protein VirB8
MRLWTQTNPESPLNRYKDGSTVEVTVSSVSFFHRANGVADLAQIRYDKGQRQAGAADEQRTHWIATVQYAYGEPSKDVGVRRWNPLGFKIVEFRPEPEVLTPPAAQASDTPGAPTASTALGHSP